MLYSSRYSPALACHVPSYNINICADYSALAPLFLDIYYQYTGDKEFLEGEANRSIVLVNYTFIIISFSILIGFLIVEFLFPMIFKNGQTLGKKIFGIGVMRVDGVKVTTPILFVRSILGKFTIETMMPVLMVIMIYSLW